MDPYFHTFIAVSAIVGAFYAGKHFYIKSSMEKIIVNLLENLENEGFIATMLDKDGEKEIIPVNELIAKALRESQNKKVLDKS